MKKLMCMVLTLAMLLCIPFSAFAAEVPGKNQKSDMMSFTLMDKNGKNRVVKLGQMKP